MKCPHHLRKDATGYCSVCGDFGCEECLTRHDGQLLCKKHYKPIQKEIDEQNKFAKARKRQARQRLVVHFKNGAMEQGICFALNPKEASFHLDKVDDQGVTSEESVTVPFIDVKAVFYVKTFKGKKGGRTHHHADNTRSNHPHRDPTAEGTQIIAVFEDGEVVRGHTTHHYSSEDKRFFLIPDDPDDNNISILVEASALKGVYSPEEYEAKRKEEREVRKKEVKEGKTALSQEETMGDFYFETRNYNAALEQYTAAQNKVGESGRVLKKIVLCKFNIGVQHIKRREYKKALSYMEEVLKFAPNNERARKKVHELRRIMQKEKRREKVEERLQKKEL